MKLTTFDLEIAKVLPDGATDLHAYGPLGIACAALGFADRVDFVTGAAQLSREEAGALVGALERLVADGYRLVTWNGTAFDFAVLAEESGLKEQCAQLAMEHTDLMLCVTFQAGHFLGLEKALTGAGFAGKKHTVTLSNGVTISAMTGSLAPQLWAQDEREAVLSYLHDDVSELLQLAQWVEAKKTIRWLGSTGNKRNVPVPKLYTVRELFKLPKPDTSWMTSPPKREQFTAWMR